MKNICFFVFFNYFLINLDFSVFLLPRANTDSLQCCICNFTVKNPKMYVTCDDSYNSYFGNTRRHVENHEKLQKTTPRNTINLLLKMDEATQKTQKSIFRENKNVNYLFFEDSSEFLMKILVFIFCEFRPTSAPSSLCDDDSFYNPCIFTCFSAPSNEYGRPSLWIFLDRFWGFFEPQHCKD